MEEVETKQKVPATGSPVGLVICLAIGVAAYALLSALVGMPAVIDSLTYESIIDGITGSIPKQLLWFLMDFTEPEFYGSALAGAGVIIGGAIAWQLARKNSRFQGTTVCYGEYEMFPWVLLSQVISLALTIFVFGYIGGFDAEGVSFVATFIPIVAAPPATMLLYGPSVPALLVSSILAALVCSPTATFLTTYVTGPWGLPSVVGNVAAMAITGCTIFLVLRVLPWVQKVPVPNQKPTSTPVEDVTTPKWLVSRVLCDFSEAPFYGNEIASLCEFAGLIVGLVLCAGHNVNGAEEALPAIVLSQFVASAVGAFLYADKFADGNWYATYVPVVSTGPACVLAFGASIPVALFAGALGGVLGGPIAEFFGHYVPEDVHGTVANVASMALTTTIVYAVMLALPWF